MNSTAIVKYTFRRPMYNFHKVKYEICAILSVSSIKIACDMTYKLKTVDVKANIHIFSQSSSNSIKRQRKS